MDDKTTLKRKIFLKRQAVAILQEEIRILKERLAQLGKSPGHAQTMKWEDKRGEC